MKAWPVIVRFQSHVGGASAVEFALVAPLFFAIVFSFFESGWLMTRTVMQDAALTRVIRELRVDVDMPVTASDIKREICGRSLVFSDCEANTMVEMVTLRSASDIIPSTQASCRHGGQTPPFVPGARGAFVFVRVCTTVKPITPMIGLAVALPDDATGSFGIVSAGGFVNEPQ